MAAWLEIILLNVLPQALVGFTITYYLPLAGIWLLKYPQTLEATSESEIKEGCNSPDLETPEKFSSFKLRGKLQFLAIVIKFQILTSLRI